MLSREEILRCADRPPVVESVPVPQWGGDVFVRTLTAKELDAFEASNVKTNRKGEQVRGTANLRGRLLALVLSDERGNRLCRDDDAGMLGDMPLPAVEAVLRVANRLNGLTEELLEEAKGNSDAAPSAAS